MKVSKKIYNKIIYTLSILNGIQSQYEKISVIYNEINFYYLEDFEQFDKFLKLEKYPNKKAFRQFIPVTLAIKSKLKVFNFYWNIFAFEYARIKRAYVRRNYKYAFGAIQKPILIDNKLYTLIELANRTIKLSEKIASLYNELEWGLEQLENLQTFSKLFACKYRKYRNVKLSLLKDKIFTAVSKNYQQEEFHAASNLLQEFVTDTNFKNGRYTDIYNKKTYDDYFCYLEREEQEYKELLGNVKQAYSVENIESSSKIYQKWCVDNGWSDLFFQEEKWYAFAPNAVIPQEVRIPLKIKDIFKFLIDIILIVLTMFLFLLLSPFLLLVGIYKIAEYCYSIINKLILIIRS